MHWLVIRFYAAGIEGESSLHVEQESPAMHDSHLAKHG